MKCTPLAFLLCYCERPDTEAGEKLSGDEREEAERNNEATRLWLAGIDLLPAGGDQFQVHSNGPDEIALWFVDTDYIEEGIFCATPTS